MLNSQTGQVVLITGGTRGIGNGVARVFVGAGAAVTVCGRDEAAGEAAAAEINQPGPGSCRFIRCDVSDTDDNQRLVRLTIESMGRLDCLVNNAGWHPPYTTIDDTSVRDFSRLLHLNVTSYFELCKLALPALRLTSGCIINIGSLVGAIGQVGACAYTATKGAIEGLTKALAIDEARYGVRVNAVLPGVIETPLYREYLNAQADPAQAELDVSRWQWLGRVGKAEEVGHLCLFLAGDGAKFLTGAAIPLSGGAELGYGTKEY